MRTHPRTHARTHASTHARTCTHARTRTHARTHALTHAHARTHARARSRQHARMLARSRVCTQFRTLARSLARSHELTRARVGGWAWARRYPLLCSVARLVGLLLQLCDMPLQPCAPVYARAHPLSVRACEPCRAAAQRPWRVSRGGCGVHHACVSCVPIHGMRAERAVRGVSRACQFSVPVRLVCSGARRAAAIPRRAGGKGTSSRAHAPSPCHRRLWSDGKNGGSCTFLIRTTIVLGDKQQKIEQKF